MIAKVLDLMLGKRLSYAANQFPVTVDRENEITDGGRNYLIMVFNVLFENYTYFIVVMPNSRIWCDIYSYI